MIKRLFIGLVCAVGGIVAVVLLAGGVLAWRLTGDPVSLGPLTPVLELALNAATDEMDVTVEDAILAWNRPEGILRVRLVDARATSPDDAVVLRVPELSMGLGTGALLRGAVVPTDIDVVRPHLKVVRLAGDRSTQAADSGDAPFSPLMSTLAEWAGPEREARGLRLIRVEGGSLDVEDRKSGLSWRGKLVNTRVWRDDDGLNASGFLAATSDGQQSELALAAEYDRNKHRLAAGFSLGNIRPSMFAPLGPSLGSLAAIDLPVRGTTAVAVDGEGAIEKVDFGLAGGSGHLSLPTPVAKQFGILDAAQQLAARDLELDGTYEKAGATVHVERLRIDLEPGQTVYLPAPLDHRLPLSSIRAQGRYRGDDNTAKLESLEVDLDGPSIAVTATAEGIGTAGGLKAKAEIVARDLQTNDFSRYWPPSLATAAHEWVTQHLSEGGISEARVELTAAEGADGVDIASLSGKMDINGVSVDYLPPMPKARNASGVGVFDLSSLTITIAGAEAAGVSVRGGTAKLYDFGQSVEKADIDLSIAGPIRKVLALIDHQPLGYVKAMGLSPSQASGSVSGRLSVRFPLLADLPLERLKISADAKLDDVAVTDIVLGADVSGGQLALKLDETGMDVNGPIVIGTTPAAIVWRENFETGAPFDTRIDVSMANADIGLLRELNVGAAPLIEPHVEGPLGIDVRYVTYPSGEDTVEIKTNATRAALDVPYVGWKKARGVPASGAATIKLRDDRLTAIPRIALESTGLDVKGSVNFDTKGQLEKAAFSRIAIGLTDMQAVVVAPPGGGWAIEADGKSFNIGPLIDTLEQPDTDDQADDRESLLLSVTAKLDTVWIDPKHPLRSVTASIVRENEQWSLVKIDARVGEETPLSLSITPGKDRSRSLKVRSDNAGDTLRSLGIYDRMIGGNLKINGSFNDTVAGSPLNGTVKIRDYRITGAPGLAKLLSIMALTGILDQLRGEGIGFAVFDAPFTLQDGVLDIKNGRASGTELGMTAEGRVGNDTVNLKGTIVPFYAVNSALGKIPIIGPIFSGGDKGGGLLAARYTITGPMDDPNVTVNPLSMLTPGFLRNLFNVFDTQSDSGPGGGTADTPRAGDP